MYSEESQEIDESALAEQEFSTSEGLELTDSEKKSKGRASAVKPKGRAAGKTKGKVKGKLKGKNPEPSEVGPVFLLVNTADNKSETYSEDNWKEAATKVLHDKSFRLFKAVELSLDISYTETAQL